MDMRGWRLESLRSMGYAVGAGRRLEASFSWLSFLASEDGVDHYLAYLSLQSGLGGGDACGACEVSFGLGNSQGPLP